MNGFAVGSDRRATIQPPVIYFDASPYKIEHHLDGYDPFIKKAREERSGILFSRLFINFYLLEQKNVKYSLISFYIEVYT